MHNKEKEEFIYVDKLKFEDLERDKKIKHHFYDRMIELPLKKTFSMKQCQVQRI